ncbi:type III secretion system inner membrane ring subunit SctD [Paludibacterium purpuratum]|uniref:Type III secretion protein D n=1 Tax=Paludibacterium purpuratum TaxID=1144873 RepID=A0A4R7B0Y9_9NEIS|nr:type III secretion system inner membrane ring subunit SctD [Paludibacterium purpuratum]TDR76582.1 type III secretion protein D [Paludibacterium purpuratum]
MAFKLWLLNGPMAGRALNLPPGVFTIGTDDADLALPLQQGRMATLTVAPDGVLLQDDTPCWVDGQSVRPGALPLGHFIDLAGLHFVLGPSDGERASVSAVARARPRSVWLMLALGVSCVLATALGLAWWLAPAPTVSPPPQQWVAAALRPFPDVLAEWQDDGVLRVSGRCPDSAALAMLRTRLDAAGVRYQWLAQCDDELLRSVQALLHNYGYPHAIVTLTADGKAQIQETVRNDERFAQLTDALDHLPGLAGWQIVDRFGQEFDRLLARLRADRQLDGLSVRQGRFSWVVSGELPPARVERVRALLNDLTHRGELSMPAHLVNAASTASAGEFLPADIAGIDGSRTSPFLTLTNGMRLLLGATVRQQMLIVAIHPDGVSLAGRNTLVFLPIHA